MIKLLWIVCSIPVFISTLRYCIKEELWAYGEVEAGILIVMIMLSTVVSFLGPLAILGYILYTMLEKVAESINRKYNNE